MSNQIAVFNFKNHEVRTATHQNGEVYFCLPDVAEILEIKNANANRFNLNEKGVHKMYTPTKGGKQEVTFINEPNLYRVIFRSNKEEAIIFQNWVFEEVLPTIRKTGSYYLKISETQRKALADAVRSRCGHEKVHYSTVWRAVKDFFGVEVYQDIPASGFTQALQIIKTVDLPKNPEQSTQDFTQYNALWKKIGKLQYEETTKTIVLMEALIQQGLVQIKTLKKQRSLIWDSINEQRHPALDPVVHDGLEKQAQDFINRQNALKF